MKTAAFKIINRVLYLKEEEVVVKVFDDRSNFAIKSQILRFPFEAKIV